MSSLRFFKSFLVFILVSVPVSVSLNFFGAPKLCMAQTPSSMIDPNIRLMVHLLEYLSKDYEGAVSKDGQVLNEFEWIEQKEFAQTIRSTLKNLHSIKLTAEFKKKVSDLEFFISSHRPPHFVIPLSLELKKNLIEATHMPLGPSHVVNLNNGKNIYLQNCAGCHGVEGKGDGPMGAQLNPSPANFLDEKLMESVTPLHVFHTVKLGVPGTGMPSFPQLSEESLWDVGSYVMNLRKKEEPTSLMVAATTSNKNLQKAKTLFEQTLESVKNQRWEEAKVKSYETYLEGIEPIEPFLKTRSPLLLAKIESLMSEFRSHIKGRKDFNDLEFSKNIQTIKLTFDEIERLMSQVESNLNSPWVVFSFASGIVLREGLEAVLIIASVLSLLGAMGKNQGKISYYVHGGWICALILGVVFWFLTEIPFQNSGASREVMEAAFSFLAVGILVYMGVWLHQKSEVQKWNEFIEKKTKTILGLNQKGNYMSLFALSFFAVFREAIETNLFLRSLTLHQQQSSHWAILAGVLFSVVLVILIAWFYIKISKKIPLKIFFQFSCFFMLILATILTGQGMHSLQESGLISSTPLPYLFSGWGNWEVFLSQLSTILVSLILLFFRKEVGKKSLLNSLKE